MARPPGTEPKNYPVTFRTTQRLGDLLELAEEATGADRTEIIESCLRAQLPKIVEEAHITKHEKRKKALEAFRKAAEKL